MIFARSQYRLAFSNLNALQMFRLHVSEFPRSQLKILGLKLVVLEGALFGEDAVMYNIANIYVFLFQSTPVSMLTLGIT